MDRIADYLKKTVLWVLVAALLVGCSGPAPAQPTTETTAVPTQVPETTQATTAPVETTGETTAPTETQPQPVEYILTFAGDCTLGTDHTVYGASGTLVYVVGDNYGYPFQNSLPYFENDDFTLVNLEGVFTNYNVPEEKTYRFRAPPEYAKILTAGNVEAVNLANNHSYDYGYTGYTDTKAALEAENVAYVENYGKTIYTTESGLCIGLYAAQFYTDFSTMTSAISDLRAQGAEIVIVSYHGGVEGSYRPDSYQVSFAHAAVDAGADIVYGHHPHVLQPIEEYNGGVIYYSMGNYSFGGNINPTDKDTVVIRQTVIREPDGSVHLGQTTPIPFRLSSVGYINDYVPTPYEEGSTEWERVMSKLDGTYTGPDLIRTPEPEQTEPQTTEATEPEQTTEATTEATQPEETTVVTEPTTEATEPSQTEVTE